MAKLLDSAKAALKKITTKKPTGSSVEHGISGTSIFSGVLDVEFNSDLQGQEGIEIYDEMRKTDGTVIEVLEAVKMPLVSAKWFIKAGGEEARDKEIADFTERALFEELKWIDFLREALGYLDFGHYPFEKVFKFLPEDDSKYPNAIVWKKFAPRIPASIYLWEIKGKPWKDGHPAGITQMVTNTDNNKTKNNQPKIPWDKLILFTNKQEGDNFEGVSLLRPVYKHWFYKDLFYKISGISAERFGAGIPYAKTKKGVGPAAKDKIDEMLKNMKGNEQAFARISSDIEEWGIKTPDGDPKATAIDKLISHHDSKIYSTALAGFLNLTSGDGGSNALSKDQSSFFLRALQSVANYIIGVMDPVIKELVDKNFVNVENYPTLGVSDIGSISMDEAIGSISKAKESGLLTLVDNDINVIRDIVKLPQLTESEREEMKIKKEEEEKEEADRQEKLTKVEKKDEKVEAKMKKTDEQLAEIVKSIKTLSEVKTKELAETKKKTFNPTQRERTFTFNITEFESYLDSEYDKVEKVISKFEKIYRKGIIDIYESAFTERVDGVVSLVFDKGLVKRGEKFVDDVTKKLHSVLIDSPFQERLFKTTTKMAANNIKQNTKLLSMGSVIIAATSGYKSNMVGILFNEPRRMKEALLLNFGSSASVKLAIKQAEQMSFNRNILKLSTITHARSAYSGLLTTQAEVDGFAFYKVVAPKNKIKDIKPSGGMAAALFMIGTAAMINKRVSEKSDGKNSDTIKGLGLHHGSYEYYYPIESDELDIEEDIARAQRKKFLESKDQ